MELNEAFYIGYITKTRGLKGELQLFFEFEDYMELDFDVLFLEMNKKLVPYFVDTIKLQKNSTAYLNLEDVDHIDKAQLLIRKKVYLPNDKMPERDPDDFRYSDLIGFLVVDEEEGEIGEITHVQELPQQFIATVDFNGHELLFPLNEDLILAIDAEEQVLEVNLPEGLVDLYRGTEES
ncbi:ribosome maturation factor RimM [Sphingobacterium deserti]|uniref:Ribosome maturation factor RimM n=1 Tax=Sphingobacterium deserti TaxID=1229276 RepID=A0A0B8T6V6_9SPHI|nr:ribosome maturation factor RimM [Sphingobacterium deserti]KGE13974.1 ribosome maturation factor RimM [Sphingobacterium deserti]